jgi:hypothetical protein
MEQSFTKMEQLMVADALPEYPAHNRRVYIFTDASDYQLGVCIMQRGKPVAYYTRKLLGAQMDFTTMEKEILSIGITMKNQINAIR